MKENWEEAKKNWGKFFTHFPLVTKQNKFYATEMSKFSAISNGISLLNHSHCTFPNITFNQLFDHTAFIFQSSTFALFFVVLFHRLRHSPFSYTFQNRIRTGLKNWYNTPNKSWIPKIKVFTDFGFLVFDIDLCLDCHPD